VPRNDIRIYGVDFTCAPRRAKPITVAVALLKGKVLVVKGVDRVESFSVFEAFLRRSGPWIGGFDFPFSLPRELVRDLAWPATWKALVTHCSAMTRLEFRKVLDAYRASRPAGSKYAHRATDLPAGSSSPMKLVNPPVALMFHEGARRLLHAGVNLPQLLENGDSRIALEAYPGLLVRKQLGIRDSYKADARGEQTPARKAARKRIVDSLKRGDPLGVAVQVKEKPLIEDGSGDLLDAVICAVQAAWAARRPRYGLPEEAPSGEGWILSAGTSS
jgi:hypothetical protein